MAPDDEQPKGGRDERDGQRDVLPDDLDASGFVGPYQFPDNCRRRIPGSSTSPSPPLVRSCTSSPTIRPSSTRVSCGRPSLLAVVGLFSVTSGWRMRVDEKQALVKAQHAVDFPVGHASAQQVWHGVRSRPTWRVLCYSTEEPPRQRGLVLVDAVDGRVLEHLVEANPEQWAHGAPPEISASE